MEFVDIIIIGSGISGLYSAYTILQKSPDTSFLVLEKYKKQWVGGRASNDEFYGCEIVTGAGIGRKNKDKLLHKLLNDFHLPTKEFPIEPKLIGPIQSVDILKIMKHLQNEYKRQSNITSTFKEFAKPILGDEIYKRFIISVGYTDYENEDVYETLFRYGIEDNTCCSTGFHVPWKQLVLNMYDFIGSKHFKFSSKVISILRNKDAANMSVLLEDGRQYMCKKVIVASTIDTVQKLLPNPIYDNIGGQPFLRLYAKFTKKSAEILRQYIDRAVYVYTVLQHIVPFDFDKGVYMIAYCDNKNAVALKDRLDNTTDNRLFYARLVEKSVSIPENTLQIIAIKHYYWKIGTHYYKPLDKNLYASREEYIRRAQHPHKNILVVGEMISLNQGWTQGALESVKASLTTKWITQSSG